MRTKQPKVYIMDLVNAFYTSFEGLKLDDLTEIAHEIAYGGLYGNKEKYKQFLVGNEISEFMLNSYLYIGNRGIKQLSVAYDLCKFRLNDLLTNCKFHYVKA